MRYLLLIYSEENRGTPDPAEAEKVMNEYWAYSEAIEKAEEARARDKIRVKLGPAPTAQSTLAFSRPTCISDSTAGHVSVSVQFHNVESCGQHAVKGTCTHAWDTPNSFWL